jgi:hypothetical protein
MILEGRKMNFTAYVDRQKSLIRQRHEGETYLIENKKVFVVRDSEEILVEMNELKGLNKAERLFFSRKNKGERIIKRSANS